MSTVDRRPPTRIPPLVAGQRLGQAEFLRRYEATPPGFKAELIGGVVHVPSPVGRRHGISSADMIMARLSSPNPGPGPDNATTAMDELGASARRPDADLAPVRQPDPRRGRSSPALSWWSRSLGPVGRSTRRQAGDYERAGVQEYVVVADRP
jgi:hypothetical protein